MDQQEKYAGFIGKTIDGRYKVEKIKGIGGMAVVLKAYDMQKNRTVAIKMLDERYSNDSVAVKRFVNESKAIALLSNEHIVDIYDVALTGERKYIVMEFIDGITLKEYLKRYSPVSIDTALDFSIQILTALKHAHEKGVVHRDIKPQNIMVQQNGKLKVTDFGIAQIMNASNTDKKGVAMGTVYYISPEQASGLETTQSSDIYSMGVMLYELVTGKLPFEADTPLAIAMMQVNNTPLPPRKVNMQTPVGLEQIILKAMSKKPEDRFRSAASMLRACEIIKKDKTIVFDTTHKAAPEKKDIPEKQTPEIKKETISTNNTSEDMARRKKEKGSMFPIILGVVSAFIIVMCISGVMVVMSLLNMASEDHSKLIEIPTLVGTSYSENLDASLKETNIILDVTREYNTDIPSGQIMTQSPNPGETRKIPNANSLVTVKVTVSIGKENIKLDDYTGRDYRSVQIELQKLSLKASVEEQYDPLIANGYIIKTEPAGGVDVSSGDVIKLFVSKGVERKTLSMINVIGKKSDEAKKLLMASQFIVGKITFDYSATVPEGCVISQSVAPNAMTEQLKTPVDLVISLGA